MEAPEVRIPVSYRGASAVGDFNGDGRPDLLTADYDLSKITLLLGEGGGNFGSPTSFATPPNPISLAAGDFNSDGIMDAVVGVRGAQAVLVFLGNRNGQLSAPLTLPIAGNAYALSVRDFNKDGALDFIAGTSSGSLYLFAGKGDGTFERTTILTLSGTGGTQLITTAVGDFNGDGNLDVVFGPLSETGLSIVLGNGDGTFSSPIPVTEPYEPNSWLWRTSMGPAGWI